jgi:hypothetical protein
VIAQLWARSQKGNSTRAIPARENEESTPNREITRINPRPRRRISREFRRKNASAGVEMNFFARFHIVLTSSSPQSRTAYFQPLCNAVSCNMTHIVCELLISPEQGFKMLINRWCFGCGVSSSGFEHISITIEQTRNRLDG